MKKSINFFYYGCDIDILYTNHKMFKINIYKIIGYYYTCKNHSKKIVHGYCTRCRPKNQFIGCIEKKGESKAGFLTFYRYLNKFKELIKGEYISEILKDLEIDYIINDILNINVEKEKTQND